jgi:predicted O-linked N-acetylglucosamine transferase (SPINDLY family)
LNPNDRQARLWLARSYFHSGDTALCIDSFRALLDQPDSSEVGSELLHVLLHDPGQTPASLRGAHERWDAARAPSAVSRLAHSNLPDPERRLRIGYLCGEFCAAPSLHFLLPLIRFRDRSQFHVTCYHTGWKHDAGTRAYRKEADRWRAVEYLDDARLAGQIREDEIDILVHLSGHYKNHRLPVLGEHPAPVQAVFPNYPSTTGVSAIGHIITDAWVCPEDEELQYTEAPLRVEEGYFAYLPPRSPRITPLPAAAAGSITFGVFQRPAKYHPAFWDAVAQVLLGCPSSTLLLQFAARELDHPGSSVCAKFHAILADRGVDPARLQLRGPLDPGESLEFFARADIALDTFPYNGQTTTCECLWMGVPVISLAGRTHVARVGYSILGRVGLSDLVSHSPREYVACAVRLAADRPRLTELRRVLRGRMRASSLIDGDSVRGVEKGYRSLWRDWCRKHQEMERI